MTSDSQPNMIDGNRRRQLELNLRGLRLEKEALERLAAARIYARSGVSLEHQTLAKRHVLRGVESGGATPSLGHYVAFTTGLGSALSWLAPINSIVPNGLHAVVIAPDLLRFEMFRFERNYRLCISRHMIEPVSGRRPRLISKRAVIALEGYLSIDLTSDESRVLAGHIVPQFFARSGEELLLPDPLIPWVRALTAAVTCVNCRHAHFAVPPSESPVPSESISEESTGAQTPVSAFA